ncbi:MAG TPA: type II toxin-antitoxin system HicA family toxin [Longimicrobium sp.]|nr:type II toxin-antitoxin system HicA family toxin [Longimicrobium sp.]
MKLPRNLDGETLVRALGAKLGYERTRQTGSHIRLTTQRSGKHSITVPAHSPLRVGTLGKILEQVGTHFEISRDELLQILFG